MFVKRFQWGISESVVVALAYNHNSVISSSCYYMNGDLFEILSGSPSAWCDREEENCVKFKNSNRTKLGSCVGGSEDSWLACMCVGVEKSQSFSMRNVGLQQAPIKHRSKLKFFWHWMWILTAERRNRASWVAGVGLWTAKIGGSQVDIADARIKSVLSVPRNRQIQIYRRFKEFKKPHGPLPHRSDWNFMYFHRQPARWCARRCFGFVALTLCQRLLLPHFPHISALRTVLFRFSDYFNFHPHIGSLE